MRRYVVPGTLLLAVFSVSTLPATAQEEVRGVALRQQGLTVIEEKCLVCHNRQRIEDAVHERKNMERITRLMEKKGAVLSEKERQVMNHFWKAKMFKEKDEGKRSPQQQDVPPTFQK